LNEERYSENYLQDTSQQVDSGIAACYKVRYSEHYLKDTLQQG